MGKYSNIIRKDMFWLEQGGRNRSPVQADLVIWADGQNDGTQSFDRTANGYDVQWINSGAVAFNGVDQYGLAEIDPITIADGFMMEIWLKTTSINKAAMLVGGGGSGGKQANFFINPTGTIGFNIDNDITTTSAISSSLINDGTWQKIRAQIDGTTAQIYVNDALERSVSVSAIIPFTTNGLGITLAEAFGVSGNELNLKMAGSVAYACVKQNGTVIFKTGCSEIFGDTCFDTSGNGNHMTLEVGSGSTVEMRSPRQSLIHPNMKNGFSIDGTTGALIPALDDGSADATGGEITHLPVGNGIFHNGAETQIATRSELAHSALFGTDVSFEDAKAFVNFSDGVTFVNFKTINGVCHWYKDVLVYSASKEFTRGEYNRLAKLYPNTCGGGIAPFSENYLAEDGSNYVAEDGSNYIGE